MAEIVVVEINDKADHDAWNRYVAAHNEGNYALTTSWAEAIRRTYGHRAWLVGVKDGSRLLAGVPVVELRCTARTVFATGPFGSAAGILADEPTHATEVAAALIDMVRKAGAQYLEIKGSTRHPDLLVNREYACYEVTLQSPEQMWELTIESRNRTAIRQAQRGGLVVAWDAELTSAWQEILSRKLRQLGTPPHSRTLVPNILKVFGEAAHIGVVLDASGKVIAGVLMIVCGRRASLVYGAASPGLERLRPYNLAYWEAMCRAHALGASHLDFGRSIGDSGGGLFKRSFGAVATPLPYSYYLARGRRIPRLHQANPRLELARRIWSHLPLALTNRLGPHLIRCVP